MSEFYAMAQRWRHSDEQYNRYMNRLLSNRQTCLEEVKNQTMRQKCHH